MMRPRVFQITSNGLKHVGTFDMVPAHLNIGQTITLDKPAGELELEVVKINNVYVEVEGSPENEQTLDDVKIITQIPMRR